VQHGPAGTHVIDVCSQSHYPSPQKQSYKIDLKKKKEKKKKKKGEHKKIKI